MYPEDLSKVTDIFMKYKVGVTFFDVNGTGRTPRDAPEVIHSYSTRRTTIPKFVQKIEVKIVVPDSSAKQILDDLINMTLFIRDVSYAYELGTNVNGDEVLSSK